MVHHLLGRYDRLAALAAIVASSLALVLICSGCGKASIKDTSVLDSSPSSSAAPAEEPTTQKENAPAAKPPTNLAWRDEDFAVDPDRATDWDYEGTDEKVVYLTIDDGPSDKTQEVLDILDRYGVKATFFVTGQDPDYFPMIKEAYSRGHTIGLHTYTHDYETIYESEQAYFDDLDAIGAAVEEQIGYVPCFIRFPGGSSNSVSANYCEGIMSALVNDVQLRGYQYYDWNMSVGDGSEHTAEEIAGYGTEESDADNIVLLCHDSAPKQTTVDALPEIIEHWQGLGYTFKAIDRTTYVPHHSVNN
ncbi:MAG: polysaccharide deacetylase family protein [Coriobacteriales bacterium]|jgi:peptidoglycan/xylan/chitin deacetylase (PgdA/CDA1 family)